MRLWVTMLGLGTALLLARTSDADVVAVKAPMTCSRGGGGKSMTASLHLPKSAATGSIVTVRIDSMSSGEISHLGLNYLFDMATDYAFPSGATFVEGSERVVAGTGTGNVLPGARIWHDAWGIHTLLPSRVKNGSSYTPPSFEFQVRVEAPPGGAVAFKFLQYHVMANAFLVGNVKTVCTPDTKPFVMATVPVTAPVTAAVP